MGKNDMYNNMKAAALLLSAVLLSGCGGKEIPPSETERVTFTTTAETAAPELAEVPDMHSPVITLPDEEEPVTETVTTTVTEAPKEPVGIKEELLSGHRFSVSDFPKQVYSNKKLKKAFSDIDAICGEYGYSISFVYKNVITGAVCAYNENRYYGCCSTIKVPFCKSLLAKGIDLDEKVTINDLWIPLAGTVAESGYGSQYTARELIKLAVTESDNSAYLNLVNKYGFYDFNDMNNELGVGYYLGYGYIFNECTAADLLKEYEDVFWYANDTKRGDWLIRLMQKTEHETQITAQLSDKYPVSHKYGSDWDQMCYHDCAICYADLPFVLVIMTEQIPETHESDEVFHRLAEQFDIINEQPVPEE